MRRLPLSSLVCYYIRLSNANNQRFLSSIFQLFKTFVISKRASSFSSFSNRSNKKKQEHRSMVNQFYQSTDEAVPRIYGRGSSSAHASKFGKALVCFALPSAIIALR